MSVPRQSLAQYLRAKRKAAGIRQTEVAKQMGYATSQFVSNWERGLSQPPVNALPTLAKLYGIDPDELFEVLVEENVRLLITDLNAKFKDAK